MRTLGSVLHFQALTKVSGRCTFLTHGDWQKKNIDSPYNTYEYTGLPPHPISDPGVWAIEAVLHPAATDCLYYLHDHDHQIHCAATYEEHLANIDTYLK